MQFYYVPINMENLMQVKSTLIQTPSVLYNRNIQKITVSSIYSKRVYDALLGIRN